MTLSRPKAAVADVATRAIAMWRAHPRGIAGAGLLTAIAAGVSVATLATDREAEIAPPAPPAMTIRPLAPEQAIKLNAEIPVTGGSNPSAKAFVFSGDATARAQAINCLASAIYYEAGNQDENGERAVAQVVLNRVRHPAFPASVCGVVYQGSTRPTGCQFTFTCDGSLQRRPDADGWRRATRVAEQALSGNVYQPVGWATHYHADYVVPYWASTMAKNAVVGDHLFYRWSGGWGQPAVFARLYNGHEPNAGLLRQAALTAVHVVATQPGSLAEAIEKIPGAEPLKLSPSLRGDKRVAIRFNLAAWKASNEIKHEDYSKQFAVSDNLKWSLAGGGSESSAPLGRQSAPVGNGSADGASAQR